jgi:putative NIF3 family GTP cyclohydrolase 1 type 2
MIFKPLKKIDLCGSASKKAVTLIRHDICAASFHTRLDSVDGGVNDCLLKALNLADSDITGNIEYITDPDDNNIPIGRLATLKEEKNINDFIIDIKKSFRKFNEKEFVCDLDTKISYLKGGGKVKKIGVVSGSGMDFAGIAKKMGADTFLTGEGKYHDILDAYESLGDSNGGERLNIIMAGHFDTEIVVLPFIKQKILEKFLRAAVDYFIGISDSRENITI